MIKQMYEKAYSFLSRTLGHTPSKLQMCQYVIKGVRDRLLHGSTVTDFFELTFFNKSYREKQLYMTWPLSKEFVFTMDDRETEAYYSDKFNMYSALQKYLGRDILFIKKDTPRAN